MKKTVLVMIAIGMIMLSAIAAQPAKRPPRPDQVSGDTRAEHMLDAHNAWRKRYGVPHLTWSPELAEYAQQWADTLAQNDRFEHRGDSPYGENLALAMGQRFTPPYVVNMWGAESRDYNHASNSCASGKMCGHFTQVVWKDTKQVGCGVASNDQREVWVCNYYPPGNIVGRKPY